MILLDTHAFLWFEADDPRLSRAAGEMIEGDDAVFVSIASFWEIAVKQSLGKLEFAPPVRELMGDCRSLGIEVLPIRGPHIELLAELPFIHRDPFDRLLICQAKSEGLTLVTRDSNIARYDIETAW